MKNSHIISDAFYQAVYDEKHRLVHIMMGNPKLEIAQQGIREKLLCDKCELKLSKWETILKRDLVDLGNKKSSYLKIEQAADGLLKVEGLRYQEFKLAVLSILWRMSISSDPFFEKYCLGPYEEKLRQLLWSEDGLDETKYPIMVARYELDGSFHPGIIAGFPPGKHGIFKIHSFIIWGHTFTVFVNDRAFPKDAPIDAFLRNDGSLYVITRDFVELASPNSVLSKVFDKNVQAAYEKMRRSAGS